ncbi:hypothetical protein F5B22DRAFT_662378 [Xylaria bambusicola]|uniref:uncharacterized protein n=1 Tax=Xylaria bambusicola TaxID=326684 RepID=UPI0020083922|nr:uncharacterized protein F5B22DRAFT_662378 [Xylaria bambusicola]KAI0521257.1 hypothetical protein F5B22DRAFT_662378 [Xylaria bambusicola]
MPHDCGDFIPGFEASDIDRWIGTFHISPVKPWPNEGEKLDETPEQRSIRLWYFPDDEDNEHHNGTSSSEHPDHQTENEQSPKVQYPSLSMPHPYVIIPGGSDSGLSSDSIPSADGKLSKLEEEKLIAETLEVWPDFHVVWPSDEEIAFSNLCAEVEELVKKDLHLAALTRALQDAYDHTFATHPSHAFSVSIEVYKLGRNKAEIPVIKMDFHKKLHFLFRKQLARRLLAGLLIRYPKGYFPRIFGVVEGDEEKQVVLHTYKMHDDRSRKFERCGACRHSIIKQWKEERKGKEVTE